MGLADYFRGLKAKYGPLSSDKRFIAGEVVLVIAINLFRWIEPFGTLIIGWFSLWLRGKTWRDVGLVNPKSWRRTLLVSAILLVMVIVFTVGISELIYRLTGESTDMSAFEPIRGNYYILALTLLSVVSLAGFPEELAYRAYFFNRVNDLFGANRIGIVLSAITSSVIFGWGHWYEGVNAVVTTSLMALVFVAIYLFSKRNIWTMIIIHSAYDVFAILAFFYS